MNEGSAHDDRPSDPLHGASVTAPTDTPTAFPIARPVASPAGIVRRLLDVEFLLYPLSRGQAVVDAIVVLALWFVLDAVAATIGISIAASQHGLELESVADLPPQVRSGLLFPMLVVRCVVTVALVVTVVLLRKQSLKAVGLTTKSLPANTALGAGLTVVVYGLLALALVLMLLVWPDVPEQMRKNASTLLELVPDSGPLTFLLIAFVIGIYEELLFRGFLMPRLRRATGSWIHAVIISSAIFTALHALEQTAPAVVVVAILSLTFSTVTIWRRSIIPAIVAHALFDFSQFMVLSMQR